MGEFREGVYGACKAGVIALSKSLAREVGRHGIRLNVVCPGMTIPASDEDFGGLSMWAAEANRAWGAPDMQARIAKAYPLRRIGKPEDVAPAVLFLASDAASLHHRADPLGERRLYDDVSGSAGGGHGLRDDHLRRERRHGAHHAQPPGPIERDQPRAARRSRPRLRRRGGRPRASGWSR